MNKRLVTRILVVLLVKAGVPSRCLSFLDFMTEGTAIRAKMFADRILMVHERVWKVERHILVRELLHVCVSPCRIYLI